jgi:hypothetical protein
MHTNPFTEQNVKRSKRLTHEKAIGGGRSTISTVQIPYVGIPSTSP